VYVIPRRRDIAIRGGRLTLTPRMWTVASRTFRSISSFAPSPRERGRKAIGIILSGPHRRHRGAPGHQGCGRHHLRAGARLRKIRGDAPQRDSTPASSTIACPSPARPRARAPQPSPYVLAPETEPPGSEDKVLAEILANRAERGRRRLHRVQGAELPTGGSPAGWPCAEWRAPPCPLPERPPDQPNEPASSTRTSSSTSRRSSGPGILRELEGARPPEIVKRKRDEAPLRVWVTGCPREKRMYSLG